MAILTPLEQEWKKAELYMRGQSVPEMRGAFLWEAVALLECAHPWRVQQEVQMDASTIKKVKVHNWTVASMRIELWTDEARYVVFAQINHNWTPGEPLGWLVVEPHG